MLGEVYSAALITCMYIPLFTISLSTTLSVVTSWLGKTYPLKGEGARFSRLERRPRRPVSFGTSDLPRLVFVALRSLVHFRCLRSLHLLDAVRWFLLVHGPSICPGDALPPATFSTPRGRTRSPRLRSLRSD